MKYESSEFGVRYREAHLQLFMLKVGSKFNKILKACSAGDILALLFMQNVEKENTTETDTEQQ